MPAALNILLGAAFTLLTAAGLGRALFHWLRPPFYRQERPLFGFLAGSAILSLILFLMGAAGLYANGYFWALRVIGLGLFVWFRPRRAGDALSLPALPAVWRYGFLAVFLVFAAYGVLHAMAPERSPDGSAYHLSTAGTYYRAHAMPKMPNHMYAHLSQGLEMLFLFAYSMGRHSAAACVHAAFWLVLPLLMLRFGQRFGFARSAAAAAVIVFVTPVVAVDGATAYNDVATATVLFALVYLGEILAETRDRSLAVWLGILAGFTYALKYTAAAGAVYAFGILLWRCRHWRPVLVFAASAALIAAPWPIRNWLYYGNPISPLGNEIFPNPYITASFEQGYREAMRWYPGLESARDIPFELTMRGEVLGGFLGPVFLLAPLALLGLRDACGRRLLLAALLFGAPFAMNIGTRFLIPALPPLVLALAAGLRGVPLLAAALAVAHAVLSFPAVLPAYCAKYAWRIDRFLWSQAPRIEPEDAFLRRVFPDYRVVQLLEAHTPPGAVVFTAKGMPEAYTSREIRVAYQSAENERLNHMLLVPVFPDYQRTIVWRFRIAPQKLSAVRVVQSAPPAHEFWTVYEMRLGRAGRELPRRPSWRLRARPNIWDVPLAFDNSPYTRWYPAARLRPGMFIEVDFGTQAEEIDYVDLESSTDHWGAQLRLEGRTAARGWELLSGGAADHGVAPPLDMRRAAIEELKRHGITHLVVNASDAYFADLRDRAQEWGIRPLASASDAILYVLQ